MEIGMSLKHRSMLFLLGRSIYQMFHRFPVTGYTRIVNQPRQPAQLGHSLSRTQITSFGETRNRKLVIDRPCDTQITETKLVIAFF